ncbi:phospho-sugar mutase [Nocardiopsis sp. NRRL B-16309]|uniref:phospho-sugar mutase n=1 Tax=Nocardiopsis sp. NRRL B-16309 TaxID=1519494 RepID=UPI0006AF418B|nr:phospho-sugar mutase [Nocardiopsis sp. NRRL B-16309]KOX23884.1 phosphomannomutase [Nocardiopsis sp. NRRL B-16309]
MTDAELLTRARDWLDQDPDPDTRAELAGLLALAEDGGEDALADLADRFAGGLEFGTAGLRGALGAGPNRMNRVVVMRAAAGIAAWLGGGRHVVIGYDARHRSADFAAASAAVLTGAGHRVSVLPGPLPTPVLAFAVRDLGADAGIMVTASHNPPQDNGYKVYVGGSGPDAGAQIVSPIDTEIAAAIDAVGPVGSLPLGEDWTVLGEEAVERYLAAVTALPLGSDRDLSTAYTAMHGVGGRVLLRAMERAGFPRPAVVAAQFEPDPDFPTVEFPNPEEPGAMDMAAAEGEAAGADLVIANDPDADRLAVAVPGYGLLTGNEVGGLLAEYVLDHTSGPERVVATSIVSSSLLARIAADRGVHYEETLTGFKWLARAGAPGQRRVFCFEEALGYCVGGDGGRPVADKDGISAALVVAALAAGAKREGMTLVDLLDAQARRYGLHLSDQLSVRVDDLSVIAAAMGRLRAEPPAAFGPLKVAGVDDFAGGRGDLPPTDALRFRLEGSVRGRVTLRPSGTEPKLKAYVEVVLDVDGDVGATRARGSELLSELMASVAGAVGA